MSHTWIDDAEWLLIWFWNLFMFLQPNRIFANSFSSYKNRIRTWCVIRISMDSVLLHEIWNHSSQFHTSSHFIRHNEFEIEMEIQYSNFSWIQTVFINNFNWKFEIEFESKWSEKNRNRKIEHEYADRHVFTLDMFFFSFFEVFVSNEARNVVEDWERNYHRNYKCELRITYEANYSKQEKTSDYYYWNSYSLLHNANEMKWNEGRLTNPLALSHTKRTETEQF